MNKYIETKRYMVFIKLKTILKESTDEKNNNNLKETNIYIGTVEAGNISPLWSAKANSTLPPMRN